MKSKPTLQHNKGAALLLFVLFFLIASSALTLLISKSIYADVISHRVLFASKQSFLTSESSLEDVAVRYSNGSSVDDTEVLQLGNVSATTTSVLNANAGELTVSSIATSDRDQAVRKVDLGLTLGSGASFNFGVQTGNGGFSMSNSAKVIGNVFSNGNVIGGGSSVVEGDVIAAGPGNTVDGIHATGSVRADSILNSTIDIDSYYYSLFSGNSYSGTVYGPNWPVEATSSLPFPDSEVDAHQATVTAEIAGGNAVHYTAASPACSSGTFVIDSSTTTGMIKIDCDVLVDKGSTVWTVEDTVWIEGNLEFKSGPTVESDPTMATRTVLMIVDNESDRINSSQVVIANGTIFSAPSSPKAYIMLVSMNEDAEVGGTNVAINMAQSSNGDVILYAGHGEIELANMITLKEVTGYLISMGNNSTIEYESGLVNLNFTSGPGGGFELGTWREVE